VYRLACDGETAAAIVGPVTSGHWTRRTLRRWAKAYGFQIQFLDPRSN